MQGARALGGGFAMESMHNGVWWFAANRAVFVYQLEQAMRMNTVMVGVALVGLLAAGAQAQVLGTVTVSPGSAKVGEAVTVTATVDVLNSNYCGFVVGFGDGAVCGGERIQLNHYRCERFLGHIVV